MPTQNTRKTIVITGGGTGGHVFPALAIAEELRNRGFFPLYVGSDRGLEARLAPQKDIPFYPVKAGAVKNQGLGKLIGTAFKLTWGFLWSVAFLLRHRPVAVVGVGGYVSVPVVGAAFVLRRPIYIQEQNVSVGIANRYLGRLARTVFLGFEQARKYFNPSRCVVSGNPIRREFRALRDRGFDPRVGTLLIMGGSQGARAINRAITERLQELSARYPGTKIVHQTGQRDVEWVREAYREKYSGGEYEVVPFIENMAEAYAQARMVVCRSGALTVSELIEVERPALFVPYPRRGQNDQTANARYVEQAGAARVVEEGDGFTERFWQTFHEMWVPATLGRMQSSISQLRKTDALATIGAHIEQDATNAITKLSSKNV